MYVDSGINFEKHFVPVEAIQYFENLHLFDVGQFSRVVLFYGLIFSKYFSREIFAKNDSLLTFITAAKKSNLLHSKCCLITKTVFFQPPIFLS
jgi:hypothetical protein